MAYKQNSPKPVIEGGTGFSTEIPFAPIVAGTTSTGSFQQVSSAGATGQVLSSLGSGAIPIWRTIGGTGDLKLINTQTLSGTINIFDWGPTYITSAYTTYLIVIDNFVWSGTAAESIFLRLGYASSNNTVAWNNNSGVNSFPYNSASPANNSGGPFGNAGAWVCPLGGTNLSGRDQGQGVIYLSFLNSPFASPFNTTTVNYISEFSTYSTDVGNKYSIAGGGTTSSPGSPGPSTGPIGYVALEIATAGFFTQVTASLYGFQQ